MKRYYDVFSFDGNIHTANPRVALAWALRQPGIHRACRLVITEGGKYTTLYDRDALRRLERDADSLGPVVDVGPDVPGGGAV